MPIRCNRSQAAASALGSLVIVLSSLSVLHEAKCQTASPQTPPGSKPSSVATRTTVSKSPNVKSGEIIALDAAADALTLKDRSGKPAIYVLTAKTHYTRNKRPAQLADFKVKDSVVLHFRRSRTDGAMLVTELDDAASWMWLASVRKNTTPAVVKLITDDTLSVTIGTENVPLDYTISDKTRWEKSGKEVDSTAFKPGDRVFIVPRSLPSGSIMARAVADTTSGAIQEKERLAASVHGTIVKVDPAAHKLLLKTLALDTRSLAYTDETEVVISGKPAPFSALHAGVHVVARIRRQVGDEEVWRITVETARKSTTPKKRSSTGAGDAKPN